MEWTIQDQREVPEKLTELCVYAGMEGYSDIHIIPGDMFCTVTMRKFGEVSAYGQYSRELLGMLLGELRLCRIYVVMMCIKRLMGDFLFPSL